MYRAGRAMSLGEWFGGCIAVIALFSETCFDSCMSYSRDKKLHGVTAADLLSFQWWHSLSPRKLKGAGRKQR